MASHYASKTLEKNRDIMKYCKINCEFLHSVMYKNARGKTLHMKIKKKGRKEIPTQVSKKHFSVKKSASIELLLYKDKDTVRVDLQSRIAILTEQNLIHDT
ncbi:hypothetical protein PoB_005023600 [Plakobranchus ocellatus]|uniref:Uncharacterized protein n=1 Tax=Plakobranchus ocellatus TaxID=259542 RepID=A0AAV4BX96_9GAST|nr:hypothetical protein PoB_005023600 [Plakobranchus ocellatus]